MFDKSVVTRADTDNTNDNIESFLRGHNDKMESYISFQSDIRCHPTLNFPALYRLFFT